MMEAVGITTFVPEPSGESPLEQLEKRLLEHPAATRFDVLPYIHYGNRGYSGPSLRVTYWSEEHRQKFFNLFELKGRDALLDVLPTDTIDFIVNGFNHAADDALAQGPPVGKLE